MPPVPHPYLNFPGTTEAAFTFYAATFGVELEALMRYRDFPGAMGAEGPDLDRIVHAALPLGGGIMLMGTDVVGAQAASLVMGTNCYIHLAVDDGAEAGRLFDALAADGGTVEMPMERTDWAERFGCVRDRFGVGWMVSYEGSVRFAGPPAAA